MKSSLLYVQLVATEEEPPQQPYEGLRMSASSQIDEMILLRRKEEAWENLQAAGKDVLNFLISNEIILQEIVETSDTNNNQLVLHS